MKNRFSFIILFAFLCSTAIPNLLFGQAPISISPLTISDSMHDEQIISFLEKWRQAWQAKQLDNYIDCYAENFQQGDKNLQAWRKHKERLNKKYKTIRVAVDDIKIDLQNNEAQVQFRQVYESDNFYEEGYKLLVLTYTDKGWQILKEIWLD